MTITVIGAGYVGLPCAVVFAEHGHTVFLLRRSAEKIEELQRGIVDIHEPGLEEGVRDALATGRFRPVASLQECVPQSQVVMICVGTPPKDDGSADLRQVYEVARSIAPHLADRTVVVNKSTVPV